VQSLLAPGNFRIFRNFRYPFSSFRVECTLWVRQQNCGQMGGDH
jgi:hypothetical protein